MAAGYTHVAIERTGVDWRPVFNELEGNCVVLLVNAQAIKAVPGRQTDVRDCAWMGDLLRPGRLKASFIPPRPSRAWRELTRHRHTLVRGRAAVAHRLQKRIASAHIKHGHIATNVLGLSGSLMLQALADGEGEAETLVQRA